jgi:predicted ester cyclase
MPPTGKKIDLSGIEIFRIENGKIAEIWGQADLLGLMQQLGVIPQL